MEEKHSDLYLCCSKSRGDVVKESFKKMLEKACTRLIYLQTCDILRADSSLRCSNNITYLTVVDRWQR